ncbi:MAG TPA: hypothetical protein EYP20_05780 [Aigarchaeota archaeon]|nr:hypothetical protein [Aigarchaeota archaeon]
MLGVLLASVFVLSTEWNEGTFAVVERGEKVCLAGRIDSEGRGYDAMVGVLVESFYRVSSRREDYSYTLESYGEKCIAGITTTGRGNMDIALVTFGDGNPEVVLSLGGTGEDMLWYMRKVENGYVLVGGVRFVNWDILVIKLNDDLEPEWHLRIGTERNEYAYGVAEREGFYYVVGRSDYRLGWDGFILTLSQEGLLKSAKLLGTEGKDYLRYVEVLDGFLLSVGRTEVDGDSDVLLCDERDRCVIYDVEEFDYGRVIVKGEGGFVLAGDTYVGGQSDGLLIFLDTELNPVSCVGVGGDNHDSIRSLTPKGTFAGYTYSFTLSGDAIVGRGGVCEKASHMLRCKRKHFNVERLPFPVVSKPYELTKLSLKLSIYPLEMETIKPCLQE